MNFSTKRFLANLKFLCARNNLKCRSKYFGTSSFVVDFYKTHKKYNSFIFYVHYLKLSNIYRLINNKTQLTIKEFSSNVKMLKFLELFIKRNYRKF